MMCLAPRGESLPIRTQVYRALEPLSNHNHEVYIILQNAISRSDIALPLHIRSFSENSQVEVGIEANIWYWHKKEGWNTSTAATEMKLDR